MQQASYHIDNHLYTYADVRHEFHVDSRFETVETTGFHLLHPIEPVLGNDPEVMHRTADEMQRLTVKEKRVVTRLQTHRCDVSCRT